MFPTHSFSSTSSIHYESCVEACIQTFIQQFRINQEHTNPSEAFQIALAQANAQVSEMRIEQVFPDASSIPVGYNNGFAILTQQPVLWRLHIGAKISLTRRMFTLGRLGNRIREINIGNGSLSVTCDTGLQDESCYIEYVRSNGSWRAVSAMSPSGVDLRLVQENELKEGCQELITVAGWVFKTAATTPQQHRKPIDIPPRCLKQVMNSLGFCAIHTGSLYRVFTSRIRRPIQAVVTFVALVDQYGKSHANGIAIEGVALKTNVERLNDENITKVIYGLRIKSRNSIVTPHAMEVVRKKISGCGSIILM